MKRVRFVIPKQGSMSRECEEISEYPDDTSQEEIQEDFNTWVMEQTDAYFEEMG